MREGFRPEKTEGYTDPSEVKKLQELSNDELLNLYQELQRSTNSAIRIRDKHDKKDQVDSQERITGKFANLNRYRTEIDKRVQAGKMEKPLTMADRDELPMVQGGFKKDSEQDIKKRVEELNRPNTDKMWSEVRKAVDEVHVTEYSKEALDKAIADLGHVRKMQTDEINGKHREGVLEQMKIHEFELQEKIRQLEILRDEQ